MDEQTKIELAKIEELLVGMNAKLNTVVRAFPLDPNGDIDADGHRQCHEAMIRAAQEQEKFWKELKQDLIKKGLWAVILVVVGLLVAGIGTKLGISLKT